MGLLGSARPFPSGFPRQYPDASSLELKELGIVHSSSATLSMQ